MKKIIFIICLFTVVIYSEAQIKVWPDNHVSIGSLQKNWGVQIYNWGRAEFLPQIEGQYVTNTGSIYAKNWIVTWAPDSANPQDVNDWFFVYSDGSVYCRQTLIYSDSSLKDSIENVRDGLSKVLSLRGVRYNYRDRNKNSIIYDSSLISGIDTKTLNQLNKQQSFHEYGVIAQEVEAVIPELVRSTSEGLKTVSYNGIMALLIEAVKSQQTQIVALNSRCIELEDVIQSCCHSFNGTDNPQTQKALNVSGESENFLFQNIPNPFSETSTIRYRINDKAQSYSIMIFNAQGSLLRSYKTLKTGENQLTLQAKEFTPGIYLYSLIVDGKEIDTKRMILTN